MVMKGLCTCARWFSYGLDHVKKIDFINGYFNQEPRGSLIVNFFIVTGT